MFKDCIPQILLVSFLTTSFHVFIRIDSLITYNARQTLDNLIDNLGGKCTCQNYICLKY